MDPHQINPPCPKPGLRASPISPLVIADRLITLAQDADRSGDQHTASRLMAVMLTVLDRPVPDAGRGPHVRRRSAGR